jgi:hypothetical protein
MPRTIDNAKSDVKAPLPTIQERSRKCPRLFPYCDIDCALGRAHPDPSSLRLSAAADRRAAANRPDCHAWTFFSARRHQVRESKRHFSSVFTPWMPVFEPFLDDSSVRGSRDSRGRCLHSTQSCILAVVKSEDKLGPGLQSSRFALAVKLIFIFLR